ncbi:hypothetical protein B0H17DRAFT_1197394 [Mycena rosella]|uniref:Uncharacterized protein n=1 Tax=Mycena rosella TaxID=1033263 RepID=A0AAD7DQG6_MYCRO|nr:hypothetical protein B0H17DRAFT_1197394 [Mycena rosella]
MHSLHTRAPPSAEKATHICVPPHRPRSAEHIPCPHPEPRTPHSNPTSAPYPPRPHPSTTLALRAHLRGPTDVPVRTPHRRNASSAPFTMRTPRTPHLAPHSSSTRGRTLYPIATLKFIQNAAGATRVMTSSPPTHQSRAADRRRYSSFAEGLLYPRHPTLRPRIPTTWTGGGAHGIRTASPTTHVPRPANPQICRGRRGAHPHAPHEPNDYAAIEGERTVRLAIWEEEERRHGSGRTLGAADMQMRMRGAPAGLPRTGQGRTTDEEQEKLAADEGGARAQPDAQR